MRLHPAVLAPILAVALGISGCGMFGDSDPAQPRAAAPTPAAPPTPSPSVTPEPPPPVTVIAASDPAVPYAHRYAAMQGRELVIGTASEIVATVEQRAATDVQVIVSQGQDRAVVRADLPPGTHVRDLLVGDAVGWAVRLAEDADQVLLTSDPAAAAAEVDASTALLPLPDDVRAAGPVNDFLGATTAQIAVDPRDAAQQWQVDTVTSSPPLPGGGHLLFPGRRLVALYGHPSHGSLGVLGEQGPDASVARAREVAALYDDGSMPAVPAFEIITTVASAEAGPDGDYSRETAIDSLRPWVDVARDAGVYVVLDLQSGRTDFLTQAKRYEELLLEPHVGLALDPEWRLGPNQVHLRQIGSVSTAEINRVAEWLAALVRDNALPQKLFLVHQFKFTMIRDRDDLDTSHPELAHAIQMDGQGSIGSKDETYRAITTGFADRVWWGWKNFYDEDRPTPSPQHTLSRDPVPVFVSYQ